MNPDYDELDDVAPKSKPEIRGGDKFSDYAPNMDDEGTYPEVPNDLGLFLDADEA